MATFNEETIQTLTELSRIHCTKEEKQALFTDLQKILNYIELLQNVDTAGVEPCNHVLEEITNVTREDKTGDTMPRDLFLENVPEHANGLIRVPPIIKQ